MKILGDDNIKVNKIKLIDIKPADYNPRVMYSNELKKLENSIDTFGLVDPIIVNNVNGNIIGGHQRYDVLVSKYGFDYEMNIIDLGGISWVFIDDIRELSEDDIKALNIALNKISGDWDSAKLNDVLNDLKIKLKDISITGFDDENINDLSENYIFNDYSNDNFETYLSYDSIMLLFDCEEDLDEAYEKLVDEGYDCKKMKI